MLGISEKCSGIAPSSDFITIITFHMYRAITQITASDQLSHTSCNMAELIVMPYGQLQFLFICKCNQSSRLIQINCKWLLHIDVTSPFQATLRNREMAFWRRSDVNNIRLAFTQEFH